MGDLTEVPVPTKFLFFLLGPMGQQSRHHEIGRSIATLMSDEVIRHACRMVDWNVNYDMSRRVGKPTIYTCENQDADQVAVIAKLISAFVFTTQIVQFLYYLNPKFQASSHL